MRRGFQNADLRSISSCVLLFGDRWSDSSAEKEDGAMPTPDAPDTIVLIHGFWVTPRSWEHWKTYYEAKGFKVLTPAYPGFEVEVEALRADPTPIEELQVPAILDRIETMIGELDRPPII